MPVSLTQLDGVKMLGLPETSTQPAPRVASRDAAFRTMVAPEDRAATPWLAPDEVWPPPRKP
ncbi:MAG: hypothetical protein U0794_10875 [Isosphaeraceae bacterium]